jgi:Histidine kinase-like ATPase domain
MSSHEPLAVAQVRAASGTRGDDLAVSGSAGHDPGSTLPRLLPVPAAWWETPAVTARVLTPHPESARAARHFTREILTSWGLERLADEAETIIDELVVNAVQHGMRNTAGNGMPGGHGYPGVPRARSGWADRRAGAGQPGQSGQSGLSQPGLSQPGAGRLARLGTGPAPLRLCLLRRAGEVMLAVIDPSDDAPTPRQPDWVKENGRGLQIVHALSSVWGWSPIEGHGKAVWAVLRHQ